MRVPRTRKALGYGLPVRRPFGTRVLAQHKRVIVLGGVLHGGAVNGFTIVGRDTGKEIKTESAFIYVTRELFDKRESFWRKIKFRKRVS